MPVSNGVGRGPYTEAKLRHFQSIAAMQCAILSEIFRKYGQFNPYVLYVDATAGPGWRDGQPSCCIHMLDALQRWRLPYRAVLIEKDIQTNAELVDAVTEYPNTTVLLEDYRAVLNDHGRFPPKRWQFGMLYVDPNGPSELHFSAISRFCDRLPVMDFLTYVSATDLKRYWKSQMRLSDIVGSVEKDRWFVRLPEPGDGRHWTFMLGTGAKSPIKKLASANLLAIDDPALADAWFKMEFTTDEQKKILQPELPPMPLMPNT